MCMHLCMYREIYFKELIHAVDGLSKSNIGRAGQQAGIRQELILQSLAEFLLWKISVFALKAFQLIG